MYVSVLQLAAALTLPDDSKDVQCVNATFAAAAMGDCPIDYVVKRVRDGASFTTRACDAVQNGKVVASALPVVDPLQRNRLR